MLFWSGKMKSIYLCLVYVYHSFRVIEYFVWSLAFDASTSISDGLAQAMHISNAVSICGSALGRKKLPSMVNHHLRSCAQPKSLHVSTSKWPKKTLFTRTHGTKSTPLARCPIPTATWNLCLASYLARSHTRDKRQDSVNHLSPCTALATNFYLGILPHLHHCDFKLPKRFHYGFRLRTSVLIPLRTRFCKETV